MLSPTNFNSRDFDIVFIEAAGPTVQVGEGESGNDFLVIWERKPQDSLGSRDVATMFFSQTTVLQGENQTPGDFGARFYRTWQPFLKREESYQTLLLEERIQGEIRAMSG